MKRNDPQGPIYPFYMSDLRVLVEKLWEDAIQAMTDLPRQSVHVLRASPWPVSIVLPFERYPFVEPSVLMRVELR